MSEETKMHLDIVSPDWQDKWLNQLLFMQAAIEYFDNKESRRAAIRYLEEKYGINVDYVESRNASI